MTRRGWYMRYRSMGLTASRALWAQRLTSAWVRSGVAATEDVAAFIGQQVRGMTDYEVSRIIPELIHSR